MSRLSTSLTLTAVFASAAVAAAACSSSTPSPNTATGDGGPGSSSGGSSGGSGGSSSGGASSGGSSGGSSGSSSGGSSSGGASSGGSSSGGITDGGKDGSTGTGFPKGTICNSSGTPRTAPAKLKNLIVIMMENENYGSVNGATAQAPYINSLAAKCGVATAYDDTTFGTDNLVSQPHYMALTSGSNCDTGNDQTGTSCITTDETATSQGTLSTTSIFEQVTTWKSYQEDMGSACATSNSGEYAMKHNPAVFYTNLTGGSSCTTNDLSIAALTCDTATTMTACGTPNNAFTQDLANDTLAEFTFITPDLLNDMHDGTITEADNWVYTYLPLVFNSAAYLRGDVAVFLIWDEQDTLNVGGPIPNVFISPYITAGTTTATAFNHYAVLGSWEKALGIATHLGCASGTPPGGTGTCPAGSTTDVRSLFGF